MFLSPALDDDFLIRVKLDRVAPLSVHVAEEAVVPAAEGEIGHGRGHADVDADVSCGSFVAELPRAAAPLEVKIEAWLP